MALAIALVIPMFATGLAEEQSEIDLYAPELYAGEAVPAEEPGTVESMGAEAPAGETPGDYAVPAPSLDGAAGELVPMGIEPMNASQTITLSKEKDNGEITLAVGEQRQIDPTFATANGWTVTGYKSSKAKAVTVDGNGLVTACAEGKAKITVKTDNKKKAKIKVKVIDPYKPDNIAIAQGKEITLAVGQSVRLDAVLSPVTAQTTLEWKSSKGKYVTVDGSGVVYAAAEGSAKITVKTHNKKKASIKVKVVDPYKPNGVSIPQGKEATLTVGQTLQLGAALSPSTAQTTLVWTSSKPGVATVDGSGFVTTVGKGSAKITVKTHNGKKATFKVTVNGGVVELSDYIGKSIYATGKALGIHIRTKKVNICGDGDCFVDLSSGENSFIKLSDDCCGTTWTIRLKGGSGYTLFGVKPGMDLEEAKATARRYVQQNIGYRSMCEDYISWSDTWRIEYELNGYLNDPDVYKLIIDFEQSNGTVTEISADCGGA